MAYTRVGWLANATMKDNGIFADNGEMLVSGKFDSDTQKSFNPKSEKKASKKKSED